MLGFSLSEEQLMLKKLVKDLMEKECPKELLRKIDEEEIYPEFLYRAMAEAGLLGAPFPEKYGGSGLGMTEVCIIMEEGARKTSVAGDLYILTVVNAGLKILHFGTETQKEKFLPAIAKGHIKFCYSLTEPNAGSDLSALSTKAVKDGGEFVINGAKVFTTQAHVADYILAAVRTSSPKNKSQGISLIIIDAKTPGIEIRKIKKMGQKAVATFEVFYSDVRVPEENLLGDLDGGWKILQSGFEKGRTGTAAIATGIARGSLEDAVEYAKQRVQFGKPIIEHQAIQQIIANMAIKVNASWLSTLDAAWKIDNGISCMKEASMAKVLATDTSMDNAVDGIQVLGGYGNTMEYDLQRYFRDTKLLQIAGGSNQIQRTIISKILASE